MKPPQAGIRTVSAYAATVSAVLLLFGFLGLVLWQSLQVLLLVFTGILFAVFIHGIARFLHARLPLRYGLAWAFVVVLLLVGSLVGFWLAGPLFVQGLDALVANIPQAAERGADFLGQFGWGRRLLQQAESAGSLESLGAALSQVAGVFSTFLGLVTAIFVIAFTGFYLAFTPDYYTEGTIRLFPPRTRPRVRELLTELGHTLRWWLLGRLLEMLVVGLLTVGGLLLLGIPQAVTLAIIAGLLSFIPNIGPVVSALPAVLIGLTQGVFEAVSVIVLYLFIQTIESYFITPLIQQRTVHMPPALILIFQLVGSVSFGILGLLVATPVAVCLMVLVKVLYIRDQLHDPVELD